MKNLQKFLPLMIVFSLLSFSCQQQNKVQINSAKNIAATMKIFDAFQNGTPDSLDNYIAADAIDHEIDTTVTNKQGLEGIKAELVMWHNSFPDLKIKISTIATAGDTVMVFNTWTGINTGPMMGMPPTNKPVIEEGVDILRFENGKAVEHWGVQDNLSLMKQLGLMPQQQPAESKKMNKMK